MIKDYINDLEDNHLEVSSHRKIQSLLAALREGDTDEQAIMLTKNYPIFASKPDFLILSGVHVSRAAKKVSYTDSSIKW